MATKPQTLEITNFSGRLTRILNGELNSGFAKFASSWGYDPFSKPLNLTWLYQPTDIAGAIITDAVLAAKIYSPTAGTRYVYAIGNSGRLYRIDATNITGSNDPLYDTPTLLATLSAGSPTFTYGADLDFYNGYIFISSDGQVTRINFDGTGETVVTGGSITSALYHPLKQFVGKLYVGNGNNLAEITTTNLITTVSKLSPALPMGTYIADLDTTPDGVYLIMSSSYLYPDQINAITYTAPYGTDSFQFYWNGTDTGATSTLTNPSWRVPALTTFLDKKYTFLNDVFGTALYEGARKILTLPQNVVPMPYSATPNSSFLTWISPEITTAVRNSFKSGTTVSSLYYFGSLDDENPAGLWRLMRQSPTGGSVWKTPVNLMVNNFTAAANTVIGWGKHYLSVYEISNNTYHLYRFVLPPSANTDPLLGVYETQTQLFSKRIGIAQLRIYTEPVITGNGFQIDLMGTDGVVIQNGTFNYVFGDPADKDVRINFDPSVATLYGFAIRITNTGTTNMTIKKIEIDWTEEGK